MCFVHCLYITGPAIFDYNKRLIQLIVIPLSGGHCIKRLQFIQVNIFLPIKWTKFLKTIIIIAREARSLDYRRPSLFAGVPFQEYTADTKTANNKSNNDLKTGVQFLFSTNKCKNIYTKTWILIDKWGFWPKM